MYRILTEDINRSAILGLLSEDKLSATVYPVTGLWHGKTENSIAIELASVPYQTVKGLARKIKKLNSQEAVLIQTIQTEDRLV